MSQNGQTLRVVIADDHPVVMLGIRTLLREHGAMQVVGEASHGGELLALLKGESCDLLITDYSMPYEDGAGDGLPLMQRLRRDHPQLPIIVLTMTNNPALIRGMLAAGVNGLVGKMAMTKELLLAINAVMKGRTYVCEAMREHVASVEQDDQVVDPSILSRREAEVVRLYARGLSVTQISEQLHRSVKTISQQKNDAMRKLGTTSNTQLFEYARTHGLI
ncbi:response regulator transcription factor [Dyella subtropica]|uniref:response regulator transcription factor n=1 Tax=Dyella subtropica TaxID=2992127 RepID=UPI002251F84B|nr:response regulator transcription factor [Dyella subtropica]